MIETPLTGGCQCGAIRYRIGRLGCASICHCRMCQKAFGGFFGPLVSAYDVEWTRGERSCFHSSNRNWRGFCAQCGTPLTYEFDGGIEIAIGSLDAPERAAPSVQVNPADKCSFFDGLADLPEKPAGEKAEDEAWNDGVISHQHPDHDT